MKNYDNNKINLEIKWRGGFADRNGIFPISVEVQRESLDERVRTRLYNEFRSYYEEKKISRQHVSGVINKYANEVLVNYFLQELYLTDYEYNKMYLINHERISGESIFLKAIHNSIYKDDWSNVFTFIEFWHHLVKGFRMNSSEDIRYHNNFQKKINTIFEEEFVGYRIIDSKITSITDDIEINSIEEVLNKNPYQEVKNHISKALNKLSDRETPDYNNSIKESISSVEAMARIITDKDSVTLGKALNELENQGVKIHPALKSAFTQLYGYTSDSSGIRHANKLGEKDATFEEAKFMLVTCSAFNNYLLGNFSD